MEYILNLKDEEFVKQLIQNQNLFVNDKVIQKIILLPMPQIIKLFGKLNDDSVIQLFSNQDLFTENNFDIFTMFFYKASVEVKRIILKNDYYFKMILSAGKNKYGKTMFDYLDENTKSIILSDKKRLDNINKNMFEELLGHLSSQEINKITSTMNSDLLFENDQKLADYISKKFKVEEIKIQDFLNKKNHYKRNPFLILKMKTNIQYLFYDKFNMTLDVEIDGDYVVFSDKTKVKLEFLKEINERHMNGIIDAIEEKNSDIIDKTKVFLVALYTYSIFGYDNGLNVIKDKYTFMNDRTMDKAAFVNFIDERRQYRIENQDRFFSYIMLDKTEKMVNSKSSSLNKFFKNIFEGKNDTEINDFIIDFINRVDKFGDQKDKQEYIKVLLHDIIKDREHECQIKYIEHFCKIYLENNPSKREPISYDELYKIFENVKLDSVVLDDHGRPEINNNLQKFLLGNFKKDNDCLIRLVFNSLALGLNTTIDTVINNFKKIESIINSSNGNLSINSMLDVIDVCKTFLYNLQPDEQDITLDSIAKIIRTQKFCEESGEDLFLRAKDLHKMKRKKTTSSIPYILPSTCEDIKYKILNFDDPTMITCGIDTGSCFKVGGLGEDYLNYCLLSPHAIIIGMWDEKEKFYVCPFVRNGNGIYGNGIDPEPETDELKERILHALQECTKKIMKASVENEKIEFASVMDLHQEDFFKNQKLKKNEINTQLSLDKPFYADYYSKNRSSYVIASQDSIIEQELYIPVIKFQQKRNSNYEYRLDKETDKERIQILVNSIYYSSIDCKNITESQKNSLKRQYESICVNSFKYIIGNKDWFIAIDSCMNMISCCLPYDNRARAEYLTAFVEVRKFYNLDLMEEFKIK